MPGCAPSAMPNMPSLGLSSSVSPFSVILSGTVWIAVRPFDRPLRLLTSTLTYDMMYVSVGLPAASSTGTSDGVEYRMLPLRCATVWRHSRRWLFATPGAVLTRPHLALLGGWVLPEAQHANIRSLNGVGWVVPRERSSSGSTPTLKSGVIV